MAGHRGVGTTPKETDIHRCHTPRRPSRMGEFSGSSSSKDTRSPRNFEARASHPRSKLARVDPAQPLRRAAALALGIEGRPLSLRVELARGPAVDEKLFVLRVGERVLRGALRRREVWHQHRRRGGLDRWFRLGRGLVRDFVLDLLAASPRQGLEIGGRLFQGRGRREILSGCPPTA